jgi:hypothetical protein
MGIQVADGEGGKGRMMEGDRELFKEEVTRRRRGDVEDVVDSYRFTKKDWESEKRKPRDGHKA